MSISNYIIYFVTGGLVTVVIVALESSGHKTLSGLATLIPVFTLVAYFFIGKISGGSAVSQHAKFVLAGTLISWVPYMLTVAYFAPRLGPYKAILIGLAIFFVLAISFTLLSNRFGFFK
ncbi:MAG: GlpM family protein [Candidatus Ratteibacteria bacterium]|nr:GlpM family protein [Candidatus Ratteibacteria bacterium]